MIDEAPEDPYIEPNVRDWELQNLKQKLISVAKRIQLMCRTRMFLKKFKERIDETGNYLTIKVLVNWD